VILSTTLQFLIKFLVYTHAPLFHAHTLCTTLIGIFGVQYKFFVVGMLDGCYNDTEIIHQIRENWRILKIGLPNLWNLPRKIGVFYFSHEKVYLTGFTGCILVLFNSRSVVVQYNLVQQVV